MDDEEPSVASRRLSGSLDASDRACSRPAPWRESPNRARVGLDRRRASETGSRLVDQRHDSDIGVRQASGRHAAGAEQEAREPQPQPQPQPPEVTATGAVHAEESKSSHQPVKRATMHGAAPQGWSGRVTRPFEIIWAVIKR